MPKKQASASKDQGGEEEDVYVIKTILAYERRGGKDFFQVEWDGYPLSDATWEPMANFSNPTTEIRKKMEHLKKEASKVVANGSPAAGKRKRASSVASAPTKKRRTRDASPSRKPAPPASAKRAASPKNFSPTVEEPTSSSEEEIQESSEEEIQESPKRTGRPTARERGSSKERSSSGSSGRHQRLRVKSIKRNEKNNDLEVVLQPGDDFDAKFAIPVDQARNKYPQELIDFLLGRIQFRGSSRCESP